MLLTVLAFAIARIHEECPPKSRRLSVEERIEPGYACVNKGFGSPGMGNNRWVSRSQAISVLAPVHR
jgi:hypothetical protein